MYSRIDEIRAIEAMATFNRRKWSRYGILSYMKFLLKSNLWFPIYEDGGYAALSPEGKLAYCKNYFSIITPFIRDAAGRQALNPVYMDLLDFLIGNRGDIQSFMGQNSGLQKIAEDTIDAVRLLFSDKNRAEQVIQMVKAYMQNLNAKDL